MNTLAFLRRGIISSSSSSKRRGERDFTEMVRDIVARDQKNLLLLVWHKIYENSEVAGQIINFFVNSIRSFTFHAAFRPVTIFR